MTKMEKKDIETTMTGTAWMIMLVVVGFGASLFLLGMHTSWQAAFSMLWGMLLTYTYIHINNVFNSVEKKKKDLIKAGQWYED